MVDPALDATETEGIVLHAKANGLDTRHRIAQPTLAPVPVLTEQCTVPGWTTGDRGGNELPEKSA